VNIIQKNLALVSDVAANLCESTILPTIDELKKNINLEFPDSIKNVVDGWLISTGAQRLVIFAPNTTWPSKFWPMKNWQELLLKFDAEKSTDLSVALIGTSLGGQAAELGLFCSEKKLKTILVPKWDLLTVSYLITKSNLLVAPDTGLLHIADLLNVKTIGIFGPTSKLKHGPFLTKENIENAIQVNCPHFYQKTHGKNQKDSEKNNCMYKLSSDELFEKILRVLN
jgi:ADP-heptose:LPS heptosyltransferase